MATDDAPPLYLQIAEQLAQLIRNGTLARGEKLTWSFRCVCAS